MAKISTRASDKLQAILNRDWNDLNYAFAPAYVRACATWYAGLTEDEIGIADLALRAHRDGDEAGAEAIAVRLPAAPKCPSTV